VLSGEPTKISMTSSPRTGQLLLTLTPVKAYEVDARNQFSLTQLGRANDSPTKGTAEPPTIPLLVLLGHRVKSRGLSTKIAELRRLSSSCSRVAIAFEIVPRLIRNGSWIVYRDAPRKRYLAIDVELVGDLGQTPLSVLQRNPKTRDVCGIYIQNAGDVRAASAVFLSYQSAETIPGTLMRCFRKSMNQFCSQCRILVLL